MDVAQPKQPLAGPSHSMNRIVGGRFVLKETIGSGSFAKVKLAYDLQTHEYFAIKILPLTEAVAKDVKREITILSNLKHGGIIQLLGSFEENNHQYLVLEHSAGGDLFDKIVPDQGVPPELARFFFIQIMNAVAYLHQRGVTHRGLPPGWSDLKPENILLDEYGNTKLADFGLAAIYRYNGEVRQLRRICGSPPYVAPEIIDCYSGEAVDVWSCGIILLVLLVGNTPWDEPTELDPMFASYAAGKSRPFQDRIPPNLHGAASIGDLDLVYGMLTIDPAQRWTLQQVRQHPWLREPCALINQAEGRCADPDALALQLRMTLGLHRGHDGLSMGFSQPTLPLAGPGSHLDSYSADAMSQPEWSSRYDSPARSTSMVHRPSGPLRAMAAQILVFRVNARVTVAVKRISNALRKLGIETEYDMSLYKVTFQHSYKRGLVLGGAVDVTADGDDACKVRFRRKRGDPVDFKRIYLAVVNDMQELLPADSDALSQSFTASQPWAGAQSLPASLPMWL